MGAVIGVYGTLRKGGHNHHLLHGAEYILSMHLSGYRMYSCGGFPVVFKEGKDYKGGIEIEVYRVSDAELQAIDRLEGHPEWYQRVVIGNLSITDTPDDLSIYIMGDESYRKNPPVHSGDWIKFVKESKLD